MNYLGNSVTAPTFLQISSKKLKASKRRGLSKSGGWKILRKNIGGGNAYSGHKSTCVVGMFTIFQNSRGSPRHWCILYGVTFIF